MDKILIKGNADLYGSINTPGAKNAALPILVSSLLSDQELVLTKKNTVYSMLGDSIFLVMLMVLFIFSVVSNIFRRLIRKHE